MNRGTILDVEDEELVTEIAIDPRVARTRAQVLRHARVLMEEGGSVAVNYSVLAERSGVTRPTLYRHWPTLPALLRDLVPAVTTVGQLPVGGDARQRLIDYLKQMRREINDPGNAAVFVALMDRAEHDAVARDALQTVLSDRTRVVKQLLQGTGKTVTPSDVSQLLGPLVFCRLLLRTSISTALITQVVDSWLGA